VPVTVSGSLFYRISDGYKACFAISDVQNNIRNTGTSAVRSVIGHFTYDQVCQNTLCTTGFLSINSVNR
jgi:regulator of protease activity HflC (stomatin/prohibitin superfamily)